MRDRERTKDILLNDILLKYLYDAHGRFERKNAAQKGK